MKPLPQPNLPALAAFRDERGQQIPLLCRLACGAAAVFLCIALAADAAMILSEGKPLLILASLAVFAGLLYLVFRLPNRVAAYAAVALGLCLRIALAIAIKLPAYSDFALFYEGAQCVLQGDLSYFDNYYFTLYPNLIPIVYFYAAILRISNTLLFARLINVVFMAGSLVLVHLIAGLCSSKRTANAVTLLYAVLPSVLLTVPQLTNQHVAEFLFLLGLYVLIRRQSVKAALLSGALIALGDAFRSEAIVLNAAFTVLFLFLLIDARRDRALLCKRAGIARAYFVSLCLAGALIGAGFSSLSHHAVSTDSSYQWKFIVGFNDEESGTYSGEDVNEFMTTGDGTAIIKRRIEAQTNWPDFFWRKLKVQWGYDEDPTMTFGRDYDGNAPLSIGPIKTDLNGVLRRFASVEKGAHTLLLLFSFLGGVRLTVSKRRVSPGALLTVLVFDAYFTAYLLIEVAPRYRYFIIPFLLFLAAEAIGLLDPDKM